jgi:hypothetical protein
MSTRSQLGFYEAGEKDLKKHIGLIYRHCDGYPTGILPDIMPFLKAFKDGRGNDPEYQGARLLGALLKENSDYMKKHEGYLGTRLKCGSENFLGYGICNSFHGDIAYFYAVYPDKVDVYSCGWDKPPKDWTLLGSVPIDKGNDKKYIDTIAHKLEKK